jgi:hypothetical protein
MGLTNEFPSCFIHSFETHLYKTQLLKKRNIILQKYAYLSTYQDLSTQCPSVKFQIVVLRILLCLKFKNAKIHNHVLYSKINNTQICTLFGGILIP